MVVSDRPPAWHRRLWLIFSIFGVGVVLSVVGGIAFVQADSADAEGDAFLADADASATGLHEMETETGDASVELDKLRQELTGIEERRAVLDLEAESLAAAQGAIEGQTEDAVASLEAAGSGAVALHNSLNHLITEIDATVAADAVLAQDFLAAMEDGNRRDLDGMNRHFEDGSATQGELQLALGGQAAALRSFEVVLFDVGGTSGDGILATESFEDPESGWTVNESADGTADYVDGAYQIVARNKDAAVIGFMPIAVANLAIEVDAEVEQTSAGGSYEYGIICRAREPSAAVEGYLLSVGATHARIGIFGSGGVYRELTPWQDILTETSGSRHLAAVCDGEKIALYVDGELVAETTEVGEELAVARFRWSASTLRSSRHSLPLQGKDRDLEDRTAALVDESPPHARRELPHERADGRLELRTQFPQPHDHDRDLIAAPGVAFELEDGLRHLPLRLRDSRGTDRSEFQHELGVTVLEEQIRLPLGGVRLRHHVRVRQGFAEHLLHALHPFRFGSHGAAPITAH